ncbi:MAG: REP-associated tyrosine transposase [Mangrovicoccus sp.]
MANFRRLIIPGGTYFFTVALGEKGASLLVQEIDALRDAYHATYQARPFYCHAFVVLPDHLHAIWTLPPGDGDFSSRWRQLKARFSRAVRMDGLRSASHCAKREKGIWQRRFWEHAIRDETDLSCHLNYCWMDPVKHGLVSRPVDWQYSSIHREIRCGRLDANFTAPVMEGNFGEAA